MAPQCPGIDGPALQRWLQQNRDALQKADGMLAAQLSDPKRFGTHTNTSLSDQIFGIVKQSVCTRGQESESSSVLVLGDAGSGKTHAVESVIQRVKNVNPSVIVLRACGRYYASDVECVRHLAGQVTGQMDSETLPRGNVSFEQGIEWLRQVLVDSFKHASAVIVMLDRFEHFCSRTRQTLLYNLFDIANDVGVALSIIGMSEHCGVINRLEKRIRSRFSMRSVESPKPKNMEELVAVLMEKLHLVPEMGFESHFVQAFNEFVRQAVWAHADLWQKHLSAGRAPMWFLWKCLPLYALLKDVATAAEALTVAPGGGAVPPQAKKPRRTTEASSAQGVKNQMLLKSLSEADLIVLLAIYRLKDREIIPTLARVLEEIKVLHETGGYNVSTFVSDRYCQSFEGLLQARLIGLWTSGDLPRRYLPCKLNPPADSRLPSLVLDLERASPKLLESPLLALPQVVQQWAARTRK